MYKKAQLVCCLVIVFLMSDGSYTEGTKSRLCQGQFSTVKASGETDIRPVDFSSFYCLFMCIYWGPRLEEKPTNANDNCHNEVRKIMIAQIHFVK